MSVDIIDLQEFYARPLGGIVRRILGHRIRARWRNTKDMSVFGLGYATPYLGAFREEAARLGALMPAAQGVGTWPDNGRSLTTLVDECNLPLPDACVDRMLIVHSLETSEPTRAMLRDVWRVLAPGGRLMIVVPNRRSIWSQLDTTPFGHGRPYSRGQLARLLREALFTPVDWAHALHMPPLNWPVLLRSAVAFERVGAVLWPVFSGVIIVEAMKQIYSVSGVGKAERVRAHLRPAGTSIGTAAISRTVNCSGRSSEASAKAGTRPARRTYSAGIAR